jgi:hypothetical protein
MKTKKQTIICLLLVLCLNLSVIYIAQPVNATEDDSAQQWALNLQIQNGTLYKPFDQIELRANVTYGGISQPDVLVTFNIQGSHSSSLNITRIIKTDTNGIAALLFRAPLENQTIGIWNATVTIQTDNGALQQHLSFTTQWGMEITAINLLDSQGQQQTTFHPGDIVTAQISVNNKGEAQPANITLNLLDSTDQSLNISRLQNQQIGQNATQLQATIQIPQNATAGTATIDVAIFSGVFDGEDIPAAEGKSATLTIQASPGLTPTPTAPPSSTPTPTPGPFEMSLSLFSWLLLATGFFTFTTLTMFLRRRQTGTKLGPSIPGLPPTMPPTAASTFIGSNPPPTGGLASFSSLPSIESTAIQEYGAQAINTQLSKVLASAKRIEELRAALKAEKETLTSELGDLNRTVEEQEKTVQNYFETVRQQIQKSQATIIDNQNQDQPNN